MRYIEISEYIYQNIENQNRLKEETCDICETFPSRAQGSGCTGPGRIGREEPGQTFLYYFNLLLSQQAWAVKVPGEEWDTVHSLNSLYDGHCGADALCEDVFPQLEVSSNEHPLLLLACCRIIESS